MKLSAVQLKKAAERARRWRLENPEKNKANRKRHAQNYVKRHGISAQLVYYRRNVKAITEKRRTRRADLLYSLKERIANRVSAWKSRGLCFTWEQFVALYVEQGAVCAACQTPITLAGHLDHDHQTTAVRGILCQGCNVALGRLQDSNTRLMQLVYYLGTFGSSIVYPFALIDPKAKVDPTARIQSFAYVDKGVVVGKGCTVKGGALLYEGVTLEDNVFVGPGVSFTNDPWPRVGKACPVERTTIGHGSSIGAGAVILPGLHVPPHSMVAAGATVVGIPPGLVVGGALFTRSGGVHTDPRIDQEQAACPVCNHKPTKEGVV